MAQPSERFSPKTDKDKKTDNKETNNKKSKNKNNDDTRFRTLNNLLGQLKLTLYGTDRNPDTEGLDVQFQEILSKNINDFIGTDSVDPTSFLANLTSKTDKSIASTKAIKFKDVGVNDASAMGSQLEALYENRMFKQADLLEVSRNLIELSEAISVTRDAIVSAESVDGRIQRVLEFKNKSSEDSPRLNSTVELIEERFDLHDKIKNFIVPKVLTFGEYYAYVIPYSKLFEKISEKKKSKNSMYGDYAVTLKESYMSESANASFTTYVNNTLRDFKSAEKNIVFESTDDADFRECLEAIYNNIEVCNEDITIPVMECGIEGIKHEMKERYMAEAESKNKTKEQSTFDKVLNSYSSSSEYVYNDENKKSKSEDFSDIQDCYIKLIDPTRIIPVKIMDEVLGYYYVVLEETTPLNGILAAKIKNALSYGSYLGGEKNIIDDIASQIVKAFDKDFLLDNLEFKRLIVKAVDYFDITNNKIKFQYIPAEYMQVFKIDCDEDGNGRSLIDKSLFYAKLYLSLLLFKMMSIVNYSNDIRVNYLRTSGIGKNISNTVQELSRSRQSRQINMHDLFSLTTMANKIGSGNEMVVPMTKDGNRPIETEILQGQEVQLNTDFMEMLKNSYILGTGVPAAILNFLNEADFAKTVEQNNTKYHARVVNYQLDLNKDITKLYKKILKFSTNMDETDIASFNFTFTQPRSSNETIKGEAINNFNTKADFMIGLYIPEGGDDPKLNDKKLAIKRAYAKKELPQLDFEEFEKMMQDANIEFVSDTTKPNPNEGLGDDDIGIDLDISDEKF